MGYLDTKKELKLQKRDCQNCDFQYDGGHCPNCGQQFLEGRFTIGESVSWFFDKLFNLEKGLFHTIKELVLNTNEMLTKYFKKATVTFMHPFRFAFLMATISAILTVFSGTFDSSSIMQFSEGWNNYEIENKPSDAQMEMGIEVLETIKKYFAFILLINIPFYALASFLFYYKRRLNFTEHLILNCYALGFSLLMGLPLVLLMLAENGLAIYSILNPIITILSFAFIYHKFFKENYFISLLKTLLFYALFVIIIVVIFLVVAIVQQFIFG